MTNLSFLSFSSDTRNVMKTPKTDTKKFSLPGELSVMRNQEGFPVVFPKNLSSQSDFLQVVYDGKPIEKVWDTFDEIKTRLNDEWEKFESNKTFDPISPEMQTLIVKTKEAQEKVNDESQEPAEDSEWES